MTNIDNLFKELSPHIEKYIENKKKRMETGFNLFYLISDYYYRETFHSDIIAALLDPCEKHGNNNCYTNLFIDMINKKSKEKLSKELINKDFYTAPIISKEFPTNDGTMQGRVDIFIEGNIPDEKGKKHCVVIENKLNNAGDTEQQLPKYSRDLETRNFEIDAYIYMPLDPNKEPNKTDWGNMRNDIEKKLVIIPAYKPDEVNIIDNWLKPALDKSEGDASFVIQQYIRVLNNLTIDIMDNQEIIKVLVKEDNIETTLEILNSQRDIYKEIRKGYIKKVLTAIAQEVGLKLDDSIDSIIIFKGKNDIYSFVLSGFNSYVSYGVQCSKMISDVEEIWKGRSNPEYPFGWQYIGEKHVGDSNVKRDSSKECWESYAAAKWMLKEEQMDYDELMKSDTVAKEIRDQLQLIKSKGLFDQTYNNCKTD